MKLGYSYFRALTGSAIADFTVWKLIAASEIIRVGR